jgi:hypothetical protein
MITAHPYQIPPQRSINADIASIHVLVGGAHHIHVLLRHGLLPPPHGFEGLTTVEEDTDSTDLAVDEVVELSIA